MVALASIRLILYATFIFLAFLTWVLAAAFVGTSSSDIGFYSQAGAELIAAGLIATISIPVFLFVLSRSVGIISSLAVEIGIVAVNWLLLLGGAAALANDLSWLGVGSCSGFRLCQLAQATCAFAFLAWIVLTAALALLLYAGITGGSAAWTAPFAPTTGVANKEAAGQPAPVGNQPMASV